MDASKVLITFWSHWRKEERKITLKKPLTLADIKKHAYLIDCRTELIPDDKKYNFDVPCYQLVIPKDDPIAELKIQISPYPMGGHPPGFTRMNLNIELDYCKEEEEKIWGANYPNEELEWKNVPLAYHKVAPGHDIDCACHLNKGSNNGMVSAMIRAAPCVNPFTIFRWSIEQHIYAPHQDSFSSKNMRVKNLTTGKYEPIKFLVEKVKLDDELDDNEASGSDGDRRRIGITGSSGYARVFIGLSNGWPIGCEFQLECNMNPGGSSAMQSIHFKYCHGPLIQAFSVCPIGNYNQVGKFIPLPRDLCAIIKEYVCNKH